MKPDNEAMLKKARRLVTDYFNRHVDKTDNFQITIDRVYVVWFCKALQNWKAILSTDIPDGMIYEVTYNGDKRETYVDAYKKVLNECVTDDAYDDKYKEEDIPNA